MFFYEGMLFVNNIFNGKIYVIMVTTFLNNKYALLIPEIFIEKYLS